MKTEIQSQNLYILDNIEILARMCPPKMARMVTLLFAPTPDIRQGSQEGFMDLLTLKMCFQRSNHRWSGKTLYHGLNMHFKCISCDHLCSDFIYIGELQPCSWRAMVLQTSVPILLQHTCL